MDFAARREELEKSKMNLIQQLGVVFGQIALLIELEQEAAAAPKDTPPKDDPPAA